MIGRIYLVFILASYFSFVAANTRLDIFENRTWHVYNCSKEFRVTGAVETIFIHGSVWSNCYCILHHPLLSENLNQDMNVVYRVISNSAWETALQQGFEDWQENNFNSPQFEVDASSTLLIVPNNNSTPYSLDLERSISINIDNGLVHIICNPVQYSDPWSNQDTTSTVTTTTSAPRARKDTKSSNNINIYIFIGIGAAVIIVIIIMIVVIVKCRKVKVVEKPVGTITQLMRQQSSNTIRSRNVRDDLTEGHVGMETFHYSYDGIAETVSNKGKNMDAIGTHNWKF